MRSKERSPFLGDIRSSQDKDQYSEDMPKPSHTSIISLCSPLFYVPIIPQKVLHINLETK